MRYLVRKTHRASKKPVAHLWKGDDTVCRMASTGGLAVRKYVVLDDVGDMKICTMCYNVLDKEMEQQLLGEFDNLL